ncbi:MAG TPA: hypothetical protein VLB27_04515, partial [candidate division Zixibacteria bacterium]|nr:hypothetical protein [candidate division Zixibacteria bacterium]
MPDFKNVKSLREFAARGLMGRLSLVILLHTALTFAAAWLLYSYPNYGANAYDLEGENTRILSLAAEGAQIAEESAIYPERSRQRLAQLFLRAQRDLPDARRQTLYRLASGNPDNIETVLRWEDDLAAGARQTVADHQKDRRVAAALNENRPNSVLRILDEDFEAA